jgi:hypothetical protein
MLMARAGEEGRNGGAKTEKELEGQLATDIAKTGPKSFHDHVAKAILAGVTDDDVRKAIEANKEELAKVWQAETGEKLDIDDFIANELDNQHFMAIFGALDSDDADDAG